MQNTFLTSEVVRNVLMLQCIFFASVFNDLILYKHAFLLQKERKRETNPARHTDDKSSSMLKRDSVQLNGDVAPFKIGIIGCGHLGTMILTKMLEISGSFNNLQIYVSTRQPHLLRPFEEEFGVIAEFNNERLVKECDLIIVSVLPSQAPEMFKEIRSVAAERIEEAKSSKHASLPIFVSTIAATGYNKLKLMLSPDSAFIRTQINVTRTREYLL